MEAREAFGLALSKSPREPLSLESVEFGADEEPPHEDEWWISTDDALDYAEYVDRRVRELVDARVRWLHAGKTKEDAIWAGKTNFSAEMDGWNAYVDEIRKSLLARVNSWDKTKEWHRKFLWMEKEAKSLGLPAPSMGKRPEDPNVVGTGLEIVNSTTLLLGAAAALGAVLLLRR